MTAPDGPLAPALLPVPPDVAEEWLSVLLPSLARQARRDQTPVSDRAMAFVRALDAAARQPATFPTESGPGDSATLGTRDVARALQCTRQWAGHLLRSGRLDAWRVGRTWVTTAAALDRYRYGEAAAHDQTRTPAVRQ